MKQEDNNGNIPEKDDYNYFWAAEPFFYGLKLAEKFGLTYEYAQCFLEAFAESKDPFEAQAHALREWDI